MGTRARIAVKHPSNGTYASIYTHWDGYPSHHGPILLEHYDTFEKVCALMALGSLSFLGTSIGEKRDFECPHKYGSPEREAWDAKYGGMCLAYGRDRGEKGTEADTDETLTQLRKRTSDCGGEWLYLFDHGTWYCAEGGVGFFGFAPPLDGVLERLSDAVAASLQEED